MTGRTTLSVRPHRAVASKRAAIGLPVRYSKQCNNILLSWPRLSQWRRHKNGGHNTHSLTHSPKKKKKRGRTGEKKEKKPKAAVCACVCAVVSLTCRGIFRSSDDVCDGSDFLTTLQLPICHRLSVFIGNPRHTHKRRDYRIKMAIGREREDGRGNNRKDL